MRVLTTAAVVLAALLVARAARADSTIKRPGDHPRYVIEVEPHGLVGLRKWGPLDETGAGAGIRLSIPIVNDGFIKRINNSVAISFGADFLFVKKTTAVFPIALQWNFFVARRWSVFGEPGAVIAHEFDGKTRPAPAIWAGARLHFNDHVALTMRVGYPTFSIGVSFM